MGHEQDPLYSFSITNISQEKGDHYYILTRHNDLFSDYNLIYNFKKCNVFMPPHPPGILGIL